MADDAPDDKNVLKEAARWLLFLPAGIVATTSVQFILRLPHIFAAEPSAWAETLASLAEFPAFAMAATLVAPRFQRSILGITGIPYCIARAYIGYANYHSSGDPLDLVNNGAALVGAFCILWVGLRSDRFA